MCNPRVLAGHWISVQGLDPEGAGVPGVEI